MDTPQNHRHTSRSRKDTPPGRNQRDTPQGHKQRDTPQGHIQIHTQDHNQTHLKVTKRHASRSQRDTPQGHNQRDTLHLDLSDLGYSHYDRDFLADIRRNLQLVNDIQLS